MLRPLIALSLLIAGPTAAQTGPGLGNQTYSQSQVFSPIGFIESPQGHGNVAMVQGYLMTIYSSDGGGNSGNGGIEFWDVSNPAAPTRVAQYDDANTHGLREAHGFTLAWYEDRLLLAAQAVLGVQIWDVTNPLAIQFVSYLDIPGIDAGDYSGGWWSFWQAPYIYVAGVDSGLIVVDATDPAAPAVAGQLSTGDLGGLSPAQVFALGNLAVVMEAQGSAMATLDISTPEQPRLLRRFTGRAGYSHLFAADGKIMTSGNIPPRAHFFQVTHDGAMSYLDTVGFFFDSGGYGSYQDGVFHSGFSDNYQKFTISPPAVVGSGSSGRTDRDEDFATVLGNLVFAGDDHGVGTALIPHQAAPDTTPPTVQWMHPASGTDPVALTTRIGLSFSDHIDTASLTPSTIWLQDDGGNIVPTRRSSQLGLVNLSPEAPLSLLRTYTVIADGVKDVAGNPSPRFEGTIITGDGSVPNSPTAAVSNVDINIAFGSYALGIFGQGKTVYSDRNYTFTSNHPPRFDRQAYLQTANFDKNNFLSDFVSFTLLAPAEVAFLYDQRANSTPGWLSGFNATGETVETTDATFDVYTQRYMPGTVQLGGNSGRQTGADSMYSVVIIPDPVPCEVDLDPVLTGTITLSAVAPNGAAHTWQVGNRTYTGPTPQVFLPPGRHSIILEVEDGPLRASCGGVKIAHYPVAAQPPIVGKKLLWLDGDTINANPDNNSVTRASPMSGDVQWQAENLAQPTGLAMVDQEVWVLLRAPAKIVVLNPDTGAQVRAFDLPRASAPRSLVASAQGDVYVTCEATGEVLKLASDGTITDRKFVTPNAHGLSLFDGRLYVTRFVSLATHGEVHVLDAQTLDPIEVIELAFDAGPDTEATGRGVPNYVAQVQISPDGRRAYVASKKDNVARGLFRDGQALTFESRVRAIVSTLDISTDAEIIDQRFDINDRDMVQVTMSSPLGDLLFVVAQGANFIDVFDSATHERVSQFEVKDAPQDLALDAPRGRLAVYNFLSRSVSYYDVSSLLAGTSNAVTELAEVTTVATEALDPLILSGKRIFFNGADERMSRDGYISCASCHMDGDGDGQVWDFTQAGEGLRNTIPLNGRSGVGHGRVHWTANFDEIQDFENDIRGAFGGNGFLSDADFLRTEDPLGPPKAGLAPELDALAAYVASLTAFAPSPHRRPDGTLTVEARRGREVFVNAACQRCHGGDVFSDGLRHDVGTISMGSGQGIGAPLMDVGFDSPTLRDVWSSAPYFHDGSAATLAEAMQRHGDIPVLQVQDGADLLAYLMALDGTSLAAELDCAGPPHECVDETPPPVPDAGLVADTSVPPPPPDAGQVADAGLRPDAGPPAVTDEGCSCTCSRRAPGPMWGLLLIGMLMGRRRRPS